MTRKDNRIPPSVVRRLTRYLAHIQTLRAGRQEWVSSQDLADSLGLTSSTVRQDLSHLDFSGISKRGYELEGLETILARILGADTVWKVVVIGAGNLGRALATHQDFARRGYKICGIFDADAGKVGTKVASLTVRPMNRLPAFVSRRLVDIGVIAVPAAAAQRVADLLILSGIRGILNLTLTHVVTPGRVPIVDARIVASLQELSHAIRAQPPTPENPSSPSS
jgi:redox-sensing transcriptional repressor